MMLFAMNTRGELPAAIHRRKRKRRGMQARRDRQQDQNPANFKTRIAKSPESSVPTGSPPVRAGTPSSPRWSACLSSTPSSRLPNPKQHEPHLSGAARAPLKRGEAAKEKPSNSVTPLFQYRLHSGQGQLFRRFQTRVFATI